MNITVGGPYQKTLGSSITPHTKKCGVSRSPEKIRIRLGVASRLDALLSKSAEKKSCFANCPRPDCVRSKTRPYRLRL